MSGGPSLTGLICPNSYGEAMGSNGPLGPLAHTPMNHVHCSTLYAGAKEPISSQIYGEKWSDNNNNNNKGSAP